jgi:hypothetical protein
MVGANNLEKYRVRFHNGQSVIARDGIELTLEQIPVMERLTVIRLLMEEIDSLMLDRAVAEEDDPIWERRCT